MVFRGSTLVPVFCRLQVDRVYSGYVDDPRNTDNAWMETVVYNFHDDTGEYVGQLRLSAGERSIDSRSEKFWLLLRCFSNQIN